MIVVLWMSGALLSFCTMAIAARELSMAFSVFQLLFFRSLIGVVVISITIIYSKKYWLFLTNRIHLHIGRNAAHFAGQYGWFLGITLLPLAEVFALEFTVPLWTTIFAALLLGERITPKKAIAMCFGISGLVIILGPNIGQVSGATFIVLVAALAYSLSYVATKSLSSSEKPLTILLYMCVIQLPLSVVPTLSEWITPIGIQWLYLCVIGITALSAHYCIVRAMRLAEAGVVVTLDFLRLPLIALVGLLFYNEAFNIYLIAGGVLMLLANLINLYKPSLSFAQIIHFIRSN